MAGTITALSFQKRNPDRVSVYLDGKFAFGLGALDAAQLRRGQHLSDDDIAELQQLGLRAKAYDRAIRFLAVRPRSIQEVRQNLQKYRPHQKRRGGQHYRRKGGARPQPDLQTDMQMDTQMDTQMALDDADPEPIEPDRSKEGVPPELIDWVVQKLTDQGYVDDRAFARYWIEQRVEFKPMAPRSIRYELRNKGIAADIIDSLLDEELYEETDPETAALAAARSRSQRWQHLEYESFRHKMAGFLQRRGFSWSPIKAAIEIVWQEIQSEKSGASEA